MKKNLLWQSNAAWIAEQLYRSFCISYQLGIICASIIKILPETVFCMIEHFCRVEWALVHLQSIEMGSPCGIGSGDSATFQLPIFTSGLVCILIRLSKNRKTISGHFNNATPDGMVWCGQLWPSWMSVSLKSKVYCSI